jgi:hypothetical protein
MASDGIAICAASLFMPWSLKLRACNQGLF